VKIALVAVPFFLADRHVSIAEKMVRSIATSHELSKIAIINAARSEADVAFVKHHFDIVEMNDRNVLARAWNKGIRRAFQEGARYVVVANLDLVFHPNCLDNLVVCAEENPAALLWCASRWSDPTTFARARIEPRVVSEVDWSCYMLDRRLFEMVGEFDERFEPAYLEDEDMVYRLGLIGGQSLVSRAALMLHQEAGTIRGFLDAPLETLPHSVAFLKELRKKITANDERYIAKWGGRYGTERFTMPFDGKGDPGGSTKG
jgi:GT2 family glycosyltransferase